MLKYSVILEFRLKKDFMIDDKFYFIWYIGIIESYCVGAVVGVEDPCETFFTTFYVFANLLDVEAERLDWFGHQILNIIILYCYNWNLIYIMLIL